MTKTEKTEADQNTRNDDPNGALPLLWQAGRRRKVVWSIAGFDPSSGAGVAADLATFAAHGFFGCSAITVLTQQNTLGVYGSHPVPAIHLQAALEHLGTDLPPLGIKIGMLGDGERAAVVAAAVQRLASSARAITVLDPVLRSSSGHELYPLAALPVLHEALLPQVQWVTPNWAELALLADAKVDDFASAESAARRLLLRHRHLHIVVTGGEEAVPRDLLLTPQGELLPFEGEHIATASTHGTGCAFSSALLCALVRGSQPAEAVAVAKRFVEGALLHAPEIGHGRGPMELLWPLRTGAAETA